MTRPDEQPSLWDGTGVDPWLPERLAAEARIVEAERRLYAHWWGSFTAWIGRVRRVVLAGAVPNPDGVWTFAPLWAEHMAEFAAGPVKDVMGQAYRKLFGPDYLFDARPAVASHLAEVENRMVRTPGAVFDEIASTVARGAGAGDSIPTIASRVDELLDTTGTENWRGRAVTVARTETIGALSAGREDAFAAVAEVLEGDFESSWLSTLDNRCRPGHALADGQRVPVGTPFTVSGEHLRFPGDPLGSPSNVINCVVGGTVVEFPALRAATRRWYEGDVVELSFSSGDKLTVTPNHPILRADGRWTPAGLLREGDHCVNCADLDGAFGAPDEERGPTEISDIYGAANELRHAERVAVSPPDFHGDGLNGQVEIVAVHRPLNVYPDAASDEEIVHFGFALADQARPRIGATNGLGVTTATAARDIGCNVPSTPPGVGACRQRLPLLGRQGSHPYQVCLSPGSRLDAYSSQATHDGRATNSERLGHGQDALAAFVPFPQVLLIDRNAPRHEGRLTDTSDPCACKPEVAVNGSGAYADIRSERRRRFPRFVSTTQIVQIKRYAFAGHVYNLDTGDGWYSANGIAVRNCRCSTLLTRPGESVDMTNRGFKDADDYWANQIQEAT